MFVVLLRITKHHKTIKKKKMKKVLLPFLCLLLGSMVASAQATITSAVFTSPATLTPGNNTIVITVTWDPDNADFGAEWLDQFRVNFPAGFVVQATGNSNTGGTPVPAMTPSGSSMIVGIASPVAGGSNLGPIETGPFTITVNVAVPAGFTGALTATYSAIGDGYDGNNFRRYKNPYGYATHTNRRYSTIARGFGCFFGLPQHTRRGIELGYSIGAKQCHVRGAAQPKRNRF